MTISALSKVLRIPGVEKSAAFVPSAIEFGFAIDPRRQMNVPQMIFGIQIRVDRSLPAGTCEFRDSSDGRLLLRVDGIGADR